MLGIFFVITYAISLSPSPYRLVESKIDAIYSSHFCFEATDESAAITAANMAPLDRRQRYRHISTMRVTAVVSIVPLAQASFGRLANRS